MAEQPLQLMLQPAVWRQRLAAANGKVDAGLHSHGHCVPLLDLEALAAGLALALLLLHWLCLLHLQQGSEHGAVEGRAAAAGAARGDGAQRRGRSVCELLIGCYDAQDRQQRAARPARRRRLSSGLPSPRRTSMGALSAILPLQPLRRPQSKPQHSIGPKQSSQRAKQREQG